MRKYRQEQSAIHSRSRNHLTSRLWSVLVFLCLYTSGEIARGENCTVTNVSNRVKIAAFPEFDIPLEHGLSKDSVSCDVLVCLTGENRFSGALVVRSSGNAEVDLAAIRQSEELRFTADALTDSSGEGVAFFQLRVVPVFQGSVPTGSVATTAVPIEVTPSLLEELQERIKSIRECREHEPADPEEFRPVDFPSKARNRLVIALAPGQSIEAPVWFSLLIDSSGRVRQSRLIKSSGDRQKDTLALMLVSDNFFSPAIIGGHPISSWLAQKVEFMADSTVTEGTISDSKDARPNQQTVPVSSLPDFSKFSAKQLAEIADTIQLESTSRDTLEDFIHLRLIKPRDTQVVWAHLLLDQHGVGKMHRIDSAHAERRFMSFVTSHLNELVREPSTQGGRPVPSWKPITVRLVRWEREEDSVSAFYSHDVDPRIWDRAMAESFCESHVPATECATIKDFGSGPDVSELRVDSSYFLVHELCLDDSGKVRDSRSLQRGTDTMEVIFSNYLRALHFTPAKSGSATVPNKVVIGIRLLTDVARPLRGPNGKRVFRFKSCEIAFVKGSKLYSDWVACIPYGPESYADVGMLARPDLIAAQKEKRELSSVDKLPELVHWERPEVPWTRSGSGLEAWSGTVWLLVLVDSAGKTSEVRVEESSGRVPLDEMAVQTAWKNQFTAAEKDGKPISMWVRYDLVFDPFANTVISTKLGRTSRY